MQQRFTTRTKAMPTYSHDKKIFHILTQMTVQTDRSRPLLTGTDRNYDTMTCRNNFKLLMSAKNPKIMIIISRCYFRGLRGNIHVWPFRSWRNFKPKSVIRPKLKRLLWHYCFFSTLAFLSCVLLPFAFRHSLPCLQRDCRNLLKTNTNKIWNLMTDLG